MSNPPVSIIIPTHNRERLLPAAIESALSQDYPQKEIIVVDDGSTDGTPAVCARYPVRCIRQENRGGGAARNAGVLHSRGELIHFLDDDDICPPGTLARRVDCWRQEPHCDVVMGRLRRFTTGPQGDIDFFEADKTLQVLCFGAAIVTRRGFDLAGGFNETIPVDCAEDVDLWIRMRETGQSQKFVDDVWLHYRCHEGNATRDFRKSTHEFLNLLRVTMQRRRTEAEAQ
ncbi:MAG: glycosyltransferase family A protein [Chthoniobacteraceae bacterium]